MLPTRSSSAKADRSPDAAKKVFEVWKKYRPRPELCRFTSDRKKLIQDRLKLGYTSDDLITLIRYVNEAEAGFPRWMRGDNPKNRQYLDLTNLFRKEKLAARVEEAQLWATGDQDPEPSPYGLNLGPMGDFKA